MARKIIILEQLNQPSDFDFRFVCWASVPSGREVLYADPQKNSIVKDVSEPELAAIRAGQIVEYADVMRAPAGTTIAQMKAKLETRFNEFQSLLNSQNPGRYYGSYWDGTSWVPGGMQ